MCNILFILFLYLALVLYSMNGICAICRATLITRRNDMVNSFLLLRHKVQVLFVLQKDKNKTPHLAMQGLIFLCRS